MIVNTARSSFPCCSATSLPKPPFVSWTCHGAIFPTLSTFDVFSLSRPFSCSFVFSLFSPGVLIRHPSPSFAFAQRTTVNFFLLRQAFDRPPRVCTRMPRLSRARARFTRELLFFSPLDRAAGRSFRPCDSPVEPRPIIIGRCRRHR